MLGTVPTHTSAQPMLALLYGTASPFSTSPCLFWTTSELLEAGTYLACSRCTVNLNQLELLIAKWAELASAWLPSRRVDIPGGIARESSVPLVKSHENVRDCDDHESLVSMCC